MNSQGTIADRFELMEVVGEGGMGKVYRAIDHSNGETVAVKLLLETGADRSARFEREADVLSRLDDPAIVGHIAHGRTAGGAFFLAMEWLAGLDLADRLARGALSIDESLTLVTRIAHGLGIAHENGIVHRDIKPSNIFVPDGDVARAKILDFGIARADGSAPPLRTRTGAALGTPGYMSPEQVRGERVVDARTDVFALGCVLFECLTGTPAFVGEHAVAVLAKVLFEDAPRLRSQVPAVSSALEALVTSMLSKEPASRPANGRAVARAIDELRAAGHADGVPLALDTGAGLTHREQRRLFVLMATRRREPTMRATTDLADASTLDDSGQRAGDRLAVIATRHDARIERLANGTIVATLTSRASAVDGASRAARLALALRDALTFDLLVLATGSGEVGASRASGEAIDRAAALLARWTPSHDVANAGVARDTSIRLDETVSGLLDVHFELCAEGDGLVLRGEREGQGSVRTLLGRPTPCVGREREIATLTSMLDECIEEPASRAVLVTAPPGIGKSRVCHEFETRAAESCPEAEVWIARCEAMRAGSAFGVLGALLESASAMRSSEPLEVRRQKLRARVARSVARDAVSRVTVFLGEIADTPFPDLADPGLLAARRDPKLMADRTLEAWEEFVSREVEKQPVLMVLEDVHWGDNPSLRAIDTALRKLRRRPLFIVAAARPEVHETFPNLWKDRGVHEIRLAELGKRASARLVAEVLGSDVARDVVDRIVDRAHGNAFYLEELIRTIASGRTGELPESVLAMAQVRFESLEPDARQILRAASVFGELFWSGGVTALLGDAAKSAEVSRQLHALAERELIEARGEGRFAGETEYAFRHALGREAAYAALTESDRILGHRLAAAWLEAHGEPDATSLAEHFVRGGDHPRAVSAFRRAAEEALSAGDFEAAVDRVQRALSCGASGDDLVWLRVVELNARAWSGDRPKAVSLVRELFPTLRPGTEAWYRIAPESLLLEAGSTAELVPRMLEVEVAPEHARAFVLCCARVATQGSIWRMDDAILAPIYARLDEVAASLRPPDSASLGWLEQARAFRAVLHGTFDLARRHFEAASVAFREAGDIRNAWAQDVDLTFLLAEVGLYEEMLERLIPLREAIHARGLARLEAMVIGNISGALLQLGRYEEGLDHLAQFVETSLRGTAWWNALTVQPRRYHALRALGRGDEAWSAIDECWTAVRHIDVTSENAYTIEMKRRAATLVAPYAEALLDRGRIDEALALVSGEPVRFGVMSDSESSIALYFMVRARAQRRLGRHEDADATLRFAIAELNGRAARIRDESMRRAFLDNVPDHRALRAMARERFGTSADCE